VDAGQLDSVVRMAEAIDKFGALLIGLAAFMVIGLAAVFFIFARQKKMDTSKDTDYSQMFAVMQKQNQEAFTQIMQAAFKQQPEIVSESISATVAVQEQLKYAAAITKADRVAIYAFHNGQRMMNGRHMVKFSCWAEFTTLARFIRIEKHKDVPIARIQEICDALMKKSYWEMVATDDIADTHLVAWAAETESQSAFIQAVYSADGIIIGFVVIEYLLAPIEPTWVDRARDEVKRLSDKVSLVLDIELK